jgi:hypothetical protein
MVSPPSPPDPYKTAQAQGSENLKSAEASSIIGNVNEKNPYGSVNYNNIGYEPVTDAQGNVTQVPRYERDVTLAPEQQQLLGYENQTKANLGQLGVSQSARLNQSLQGNLDTTGLQGWSTPNAPTAYSPDAYAAQRDQVTKALLDRYHATQDPQRQAQEAQLAARGLSPGSQQWGTVQDTENRQDVDAANQALLAGGTEQSRMLADERAGYQTQQNYSGFLNNLRGSQFQERQTLRNAPINEISALMSGSQVSVPQFQAYNAPSVASTPIGQYINDNYNAKLQQSSAMNQGLFGLGSSGIAGLFGQGGLLAAGGLLA